MKFDPAVEVCVIGETERVAPDPHRQSIGEERQGVAVFDLERSVDRVGHFSQPNVYVFFPLPLVRLRVLLFRVGTGQDIPILLSTLDAFRGKARLIPKRAVKDFGRKQRCLFRLFVDRKGKDDGFPASRRHS